jgi:hypothetical protein
VTYKALLRHFEIDRKADCDRALLGARFPVVVEQCGLVAGEFEAVRRIAMALIMIGKSADRLLLKGPLGRPRYRICPLCARLQTTPYLPFHFRVSVWRYCVEHECLLEEQCQQCHAPVELPVTLASDDAARRNCAHLGQCFRCGRPYGKTEPILLSTASHVFNDVERMFLINGRATLAALFHRRMEIGGLKLEGVRWLSKYERAGLLGSRGGFPTADCVRRRLGLSN